MEDINISEQQEVPHPEIIQESKEDHKFLPFILSILILIGLAVAILFGYQFIDTSKSGFNIPTDSNYIILFDIDTLYAFEPVTDELIELGTFEGVDADEISISSDLSTIALSEGNSLSVFTSYKDGGEVISVNDDIQNIAVSNEIALFSSGETNDRGERKIYRIANGQIEILALGSTPFFIKDGVRAVAGTYDGFRMFDFEIGDALDTETPLVPVASTIQPSISGNKLALVTTNNSIHVYSVLSSRPFSLFEDFFLVVPGVHDAAVTDGGSVAYLKSINDNILISIYNSETKEFTNTEIGVSRKARILTWSK